MICPKRALYNNSSPKRERALSAHPTIFRPTNKASNAPITGKDPKIPAIRQYSARDNQMSNQTQLFI
jgi:hypothetical protein